MSCARIRRVAAESRLVRAGSTDAELEAVRTAILVEDVFGIPVSDEEMVPELLAGDGALERFVLGRERGDR